MKLLLILISLFMIQAVSAEVKISNIELRTVPGKEFKKIKDYSDSDLAIIVAYGIECPILRKHTPTLKKMIPDLAAKKIPVYFVNLIRHTTDEELEENNKSYNVGGTIYSPKNSADLKELGFTVLSETALVRLSTNEVLYKGAINNQITLDLTRPIATENYLDDAVKSALLKESIKVKTTKTFGCEITY